jgi:hypothetical protein
VFGGTIVSNGDVGYQRRTAKDRSNFTATNHGSIEKLGDQWFVFYHRNTHGVIHRRQACAEPIEILPDGSIPQVPLSSSGLNNGPLPAVGEYPAVICSGLSNGRMPHVKARRQIPMITHDAHDRYVGGITDGTRVSWRSFAFTGPTTLTVRTRGTGGGIFTVSAGDAVVELPITASMSWRDAPVELPTTGEAMLEFAYQGPGSVDLLSLRFEVLDA